jgi:hypothetical protein
LRWSAHLCLPGDLRVAIRIAEKESAVYNAELLNSYGKGIGQLGNGVGHHGAAVAAAGDADTLRVSKTDTDEIIDGRLNVVDFAAARVFDIRVAESLAIAGAAAEIRLQHNVALVSEEDGPRGSGQSDLPFGYAMGRITAGQRTPGL